MPNQQDSEIKTIRIAGQDFDANEFARRYQAKVLDYAKHKGYEGEKLQDFLNASNDFINGLYNGTISVSNTGKIQGAVSANYIYKNNKKVQPNESGESFNPLSSIEAYANGIAGTMNPAKAATTKQDWNSGVLANRIASSIFGNNIPTDLSQSEQFLRWANEYDPYNKSTGKRGTDKRVKFIQDQLRIYRDDLVNGMYNISDADRDRELMTIDELLSTGGLNTYSLGKLSPWMGNLLYTGNVYKTAEQQQADLLQTGNNNYIGLKTRNNVYTPGTPEFNASEESRQMSIHKHLSQYPTQLQATSTGSFPIVDYSSIDQNELSKLEAIDTPEKLYVFSKNTDHRNKLIALNYFWSKYVNEAGNGSYIDWKKGIVYLINKENNNYKVTKQKLSDFYNQCDANTKAQLIQMWDSKIGTLKEGGVLIPKGSTGMSAMFNGPEEEENEEKKNNNNPANPSETVTTATTTNTNNTKTTPKNTTTDDYILGEDEVLGVDGNDEEQPKKHLISNPYNDLSTLYSEIGFGLAKGANYRGASILSGVMPVIKSPFRTEHITHSPFEMLQSKQQQKSYLNNIGAFMAGQTSDVNDAFNMMNKSAGDAIKYGNDIDRSIADYLYASENQHLANENENAKRYWETGEGNHVARMAHHNKLLYNEAELNKKNADLDVKRIQAIQYGLAQKAQLEDEEGLKTAVWSDPDVMEAKKEYDDFSNQYFISQKPEDREAARMAKRKFDQAVEKAKSKYLQSKQQYTGPYAGPVTRWFARGGKTTTIEQEKEKTKREYLRSLNRMLHQQSDHFYKRSRAAYDYYRKLMMQSK